MVNIKETALSHMINNTVGSDARSVMIIDHAGNVISHVDAGLICKNLKDDPNVSQILKSPQSQGYYFNKAGEVNNIIAYYKSDFNNWIYVETTPLNAMMDRQDSINVNFPILSILIIFFGICVAFFVTRRIYNPVNAIMHMIRSRNLVNSKENKDELSVIFRALDSLSRNSDQDKIREKALENTLVKLLLDNPVDEDMRNVLSEKLRDESLICSVISIDRYDRILDDEISQWDSMKGLLQKIAEEIIQAHFSCVACVIKKGEIVVVCNTNSPDNKNWKNDHQTLRDCFEAIQTQSCKIIDTPISVGIGEKCSGFAETRRSYIKAQIALKQKLKLGYGKIIEWDNRYIGSNYYYPVELEKKIQNCLDLGISNKLLALVNQLIETLKTRENLSCENIDQIITQITGNTIVKYTIEHSINIDDVFGMNSDIYSEIARKETLDEIKEVLLEKYKLLIDYRNTAREQKNAADKITEYVRGNYKRDIGVNDIAEYLGLSYSYVRKLFKDNSGMNIVDYINNLRIKDAKQMLLNSNVGIRVIAVHVGYNNVQSFERYFKRIVGVTPCEFRSRIGSNPSADNE